MSNLVQTSTLSVSKKLLLTLIILCSMGFLSYGSGLDSNKLFPISTGSDDRDGKSTWNLASQPENVESYVSKENVLNVQLEAEQSLIITDTYGRQMAQRHFASTNNDGITQIPTQRWNKGIYFVHLNSENSNIMYKLILE